MKSWMDYMRQGEFEAAWKISEALLSRRDESSEWHLPRHQQRVWQGGDLRHRRVLIRCYHGLGDTIQFIRYVPLLKEIAASIVVWAQPELIPILETMPGIDRFIPLTDDRPQVEFEVDLEVMELPFIFRTTLETIPAHIPYLQVAPLPMAERAKLAVGMVWKAGTWDPRRSIPLQTLLPLQRLRDHVDFFNLQCGPEESVEGEIFGRPLSAPTIMQTARLMRALDLIISVDSMPAHLAGAMGVPVWTLLHADPDWRWMKQRTDSPWYPTMRLFRQKLAGMWQTPVAEMMMALERASVGYTDCCGRCRDGKSCTSLPVRK